MIDMVEYIKENLNPRTILDYYEFEQIRETDNSIRACCKIHGGNNPNGFVYNKDNGLWFCYTGDCHGGDVFTLVEKLENTTFKNAVIKVASILGLSVEGMEVTANRRSDVLKEQQKWLAGQKKKLNKNTTEEYNFPFTKYYNSCEKFNRFKNTTIEHFNAKFCKLFPTEHSMLRNKLSIPLYKKKICIGVALRDTTGLYNPKWIYQPRGISLGKLLYNLNSINENVTEVIIVEGIFDVWAYHEIGINNVVAIFGSSLSQEQYEELLKLGVDITLSFDNDEAGNKCKNKAIKMFKGKCTIRQVVLPEGHDPDDIERESLLNCYLQRKPVK